jgi:SAM-dependent methyltransferase
MCHRTQIDWCLKMKKEYPEYFFNKRVLDVGSLDVNGNNRGLFKGCEYIGIDVVEGKNVDIICVAHEYRPDGLFDVVLSTNALEHDMYYKLTLKKMVEVLKPNGLMFISAPYKWHEHGTTKFKPRSSGTSKMCEEWANYYKNLNIEDITSILSLESIFKEFYIGIAGRDLRFWGIKNDS